MLPLGEKEVLSLLDEVLIYSPGVSGGVVVLLEGCVLISVKSGSRSMKPVFHGGIRVETPIESHGCPGRNGFKIRYRLPRNGV